MKKKLLLAFLLVPLILLFIKENLTIDQKRFIKETVLPKGTKEYNITNSKLSHSNEVNYLKSYHLKEIGEELKFFILDQELKTKRKFEDIHFNKQKKISTFGKNVKLEITRYHNRGQITSGIANFFPGSAYLDFDKDNLWLLSSRGILGYGKINDDKIIFKQIKNNLEEFINQNQFKKEDINTKKIWYGFRDIKIFDDKIFVSFTDEIKKDCWNTSVVFSEIDYNNLKFQALFQAEDCIHIKNNLDNEFNAFHSGGRIININNKEILFSTGEYRQRYLAQKVDSINGKILKINIDTKNHEILSMGHRNPQGLFYNKSKNLIIETEHGPLGGDEINLIKLDNQKIPNYGWPIASYGEHYGGKSEKNKQKYKKYPLLKSHKNNGFVEPLKHFGSLGISEVTRINSEIYVFSTLNHNTLTFFEIDENKYKELGRVNINERIRDIINHDNKLILFLEDTPSIALIDIDKINIQK